MRTLLCIMLGTWLFGVTAAAAQGLPEGTFVSSVEGCAALQEKAVSELGEDFDFYILNKNGISAYNQRCDFAETIPRKNARWLTTAFCEEDGYIYPDVFAIAQKDNGGLAVTRLTDITQQQGSEAELPENFADDMDPVEIGREQTEDEADDEDEAEEAGATDAVSKPDGFNHYILCPSAKP